MFEYLQLDFQPKADPQAIVCVGPVRFTLLTPQLIRMEYDPNEGFEDRPTQVFWNRNLPLPSFQKSIDKEKILIETEHLSLQYKIQNIGFSNRFLQIKLKNQDYLWEYGQDNKANLLGTVRTLDQVNGETPLNPGLLSRTGWSIVDDSNSLVFNKAGWLEKRLAHPEAQDLYFFGYGRDFTACLIDFQKMSGQVPILPRFALGNWWSRYWRYHQDELIHLMHDFRKRDIPLSVCIVDMDWHIVNTGNVSTGWTGYTWNRDLFPEPQRFLDEIDDLGLKTGLNLHPASGIYPHEEQYETMAEHMGIDPKSQEPVPFDIANPTFAAGYFKILHHPPEEMGVDFWWLDWQQGSKSTVEGLDPLFWLNHLHFYNRTRDGKTRPFIFSRYGGLGGHRYPVGFSGDTYATWDSLHFQPYFTATAANVAFGWWSHDIGGHMGGVNDPELYLRWVQFGVFSPILRLHATNNPYLERRPWGFDAETEINASNALRLRHALIPYLYTASWRNYKDGILPIRPMYHLTPNENDAYICPNQYTFGSELIAAPFTTPKDEHTQLSRQVIWLPKGDWFNFFTGEHFPGGGWHVFYGDLSQIPVFAKSGAIVPLGPATAWHDVDLPDALTIHIYPGADNTYELYEDDGETQSYQQGVFALTKFNLDWNDQTSTFTIYPVEGDRSLLSNDRIFKLIFHAIKQPDSVTVEVDRLTQHLDWHYDNSANQLTITDICLPTQSKLVVKISRSSNLLYSGDHRRSVIEKMLKIFKMDTSVKSKFYEKLEEFLSNPTLLLDFADQMEDTQLLALIETWLGKQPGKIADDPGEAFQQIINMLYFTK